MRALIVCGERLELQQRPSLSPAARELRIAVKAVGVNRADLLQRKGLYPAPAGIPQDILGLEYAGEVIALGDATSRFKLGDRVMGIRGGATYAEELTVDEREALPIPDHLSWVQAAAIPEAFLTAFDALEQLELRRGEQLLIHAVASGVGLAALQLALQRGAEVTGSSRSLHKLEALAAHNFHPVLTEDGRFLEKMDTDSQDAVLDFIGAAYLDQNLRVLKKKGRMIVVGLLGGRKSELNLGLILRKRLQLTGTVLRSRSLSEKIALCQRFEAQVMPLFEERRLHANLDRCYDFIDAEAAHRLLESNQTCGKLVLQW